MSRIRQLFERTNKYRSDVGLKIVLVITHLSLPYLRLFATPTPMKHENVSYRLVRPDNSSKIPKRELGFRRVCLIQQPPQKAVLHFFLLTNQFKSTLFSTVPYLFPVLFLLLQSNIHREDEETRSSETTARAQACSQFPY